MALSDVSRPAILPSDSPGVRTRSRDLVELSIGYGLILLILWLPRPWQRLLYFAPVVWIFLVTILSFDGWKALGLRISGFLSTLWVAGVALLVASVAFIIARRLQTLHQPPSPALFVKAFWGYAIWSLVQQFLLQNFVLLRLLRLLPTQWSAVIGAGSLFAIAHLPNPVLTVATAIWGLAACLLFLRYRNLYILGITHAIFGICLAVTIPGHISHNMRVGLGYLRYHPGHPYHRYLSQSDHIVSTDAWVTAEAPTLRSALHARP